MDRSLAAARLRQAGRALPPAIVRDLLLVGCGGFAGSVARYYLSGAVLHASGAARFPWGTLAVNTLGCLAIGVLAGLAEHLHLFSPASRLLLFTGFLGGFTTFSAFAYETSFLAREHLWLAAFGNVALHTALGLGAVWLGHRSAGLISG
jgi:CrcB protein